MQRARRLGECVDEPKFVCDSLPTRSNSTHPRASERAAPCQVWSIGSAGQTCLEETIHNQAPHCDIHVFDPTVSENSHPGIASLVRAGALRFHRWGLGSANRATKFRTYNDVATGGQGQGGTAMELTLFKMMERLEVEWIDYLKIDCERCEFEALPRFVNDSLARWGRVPVTQIQVEIHVYPVTKNTSQTHLRTHSYGRFGISDKLDPGTKRQALSGLVRPPQTNVPHSISWNRPALAMLGLLYEAGFATFHIQWNPPSLGFDGCCFAEYSLFNTRTPRHLLPGSHRM